MIIFFVLKGGNWILERILLFWMIIQITMNSFRLFFLRGLHYI